MEFFGNSKPKRKIYTLWYRTKEKYKDETYRQVLEDRNIDPYAWYLSFTHDNLDDVKAVQETIDEKKFDTKIVKE